MKFSSLVLLACLAVSPVFAGGESGGGGGGICYNNGKCVTLAQAGLRIDETQTSYFELEQAVVDEIKYIVNSIKVDFDKEILISLAIGRKDTFSVVSSTETKKFDKFKKEYLSVLSQQSMDPSGFELLAVSTTETLPKTSKTYILPGYEKLDVRGKALLLIHEANIRRLEIGTKNATNTIKDVLKFDGVLLDALKAKEEAKAFDQWKMVEALISIDLIGTNKDEQGLSYVKTLISEIGTQPMSRFCDVDEESSYESDVKTCYLSQETALSLRALHPRAAQVLSGKSFEYKTFNVSKLQSAYARMSDEGRSLLLELVKVCKAYPGQDVLTVVPFKGSQRLFHLNCK